ncbi:S-adenosyl-L-methionine-dependent methyltransferase [Aspergillus uvarum CBS 121591]|uniref:S-adenosyl-L-methionine-dependent methyltransferase n=1 Tax=Aspergillus uvarum CBS 121591 TaxID=1448315 RepID=A0A319C9A9_9EURO|nr:S-adenosyl-L-methionine-dependent methyltransferase [Aspergillus uvarum CBS 121591]PYH81844.1 S-adenosyl-L-methionine-dependent methyltransferase [Aspergillus uvarum CBS 121591]
MAPLDPSIDRIQQCLDEVAQSIGQFRNPSISLSNQDARYELLIKAMRLVQTIRGPADLVFANFENMAGLGAIRTLLAAGVFDAIPVGGQGSNGVRMMRAGTPFGPFRETGEEEYAHTPNSEIYLAPQMRAVLSFINGQLMIRGRDTRVDEYRPAMLRTHEFLRQHPTMFEHISQSPARLTRLNNAMVAEIGLYPFVERLSPLAQADQPTIVDLGGKRGHILRQIKENSPSLAGRFILQDRASVITDNGPAMTRHGIEPMTHDFFTPQPVKEVCEILMHLAAAMDREKSRVLITETILPEVGATMAHAYMDHTMMMMMFGGTERTVKDFARLFEAAGLRLAQVWQSPGVPMVAVEARLE